MKHVIKTKHSVISEVEREVTVTKLCLTGLMRSGKDAAGAYLYNRYNFDTLAFGDKMKSEYHSLFPWVDTIPKPRAGYQKFGELIRSEFGEDVWVRHLERKVNALIERRTIVRNNIGIVITDLRLPVEYEWAKSQGYTVIRVTAPEELRLERARKAGDDFKAEDLAHETESYVNKFSADHEIVNDGTIDDLKRKVDEVMTIIKKTRSKSYSAVFTGNPPSGASNSVS